MILSGNEIRQRIAAGDIVIEPYNETQLNPNSYNLRIADKLVIYREAVVDAKRENRTETITIPPEGYVLRPGRVYLGSTVEYTETRNLVPKLDGRSSIARLGLMVHLTAGFGDVCFRGQWTLELVAAQPIRIYPGMEICQISYEEIEGEVLEGYHGKYQDQRGATPSRLFQEMGDNNG